MIKPNWTTCIIARNEAKTLPRAIESLKEFQQRGGEVVLVDTGSTDNTVQIAKDAGFKVGEVGERFIRVIDEDIAKKINEQFVVEGEANVVNVGEKLFDFASARNYAATLASNNMVSCMDADEAFTKLDIDAINQLIKDGFTQFEYEFVFSHTASGDPDIHFKQSKFYDKTKTKWHGVIHECLWGATNIKYLPESIFKLEHWQNQETNRSGYLRGLALDCYEHPENDRNAHYFGREMLWNARPKSAIKELERHIAMKRWPVEAAKSMIFIGDAYGNMGDSENQLKWYHKAIDLDCSRREPWMKLAWFHYTKGDAQRTACYCAAALTVPWGDFYANQNSHYTNEPHELMYWALWYLGDKEGSRFHYDKAVSYYPNHPKYIADRVFYYPDWEYQEQGIDGWMSLKDLNFLYKISKTNGTVLELGSWKGRSTHALLSGGAKITAVDTFGGSKDPRDMTNPMAKRENIYETFKRNTKGFSNLATIKSTGMEAAKKYPDKSFDVVFIDAGHTYEEIKEDIKTWLPKAKKVICGHDYSSSVWPGVTQAVDELLGKPDEVHDLIWVKYLDKTKRKPNFSVCSILKNEEKTLPKLLATLEDFKSRGGEMVFLDTGSTDNTVKIAREWGCIVIKVGDRHLGTIDKETADKINAQFVVGNEAPLVAAGDKYFNFSDAKNEAASFALNYMVLMVDGDEIITSFNIDRICDLIDEGYTEFDHWNVYNYINGREGYKFIRSKFYNRQIVHWRNIIHELLTGDSKKMVLDENILKIGQQQDEQKDRTGHLKSLAMDVYTQPEYDINCHYFGRELFYTGRLLSAKKQFERHLKMKVNLLFPSAPTHEQSQEWLDKINKQLAIPSIPKRIFTVWLGDEPSDMIKKCIESQKIPGYEHKLITLENCPKDIPYVNTAIAAKKWVKAADYLKAYLLYNEGGIYLDADMEVLPGKNFDDMLYDSLFTCREENGFLGYSIVASKAGHPIFKDYLREVPLKFKGDDNLNFESSMEMFTNLVLAVGEGNQGIKIYPPEYFFPYNHQTGKINVTSNTRAFHHFAKSWINTTDLLPRVSIILPTLGRPEGLKKCLDSIDRLYYPKHLIETIVIDGDDTVPEKVAEGLIKAKGDYICYAANDMEFEPESLYIAVNEADKGLLAFNCGPVSPDKGNICEHFIIHENLVNDIGGRIFDTDFHHVGVDNLLWAQCEKLGKAKRSELAKIKHNHFSKGNGYAFDEVYKKGWSHMEEDRAILKEKLAQLYASH